MARQKLSIEIEPFVSLRPNKLVFYSVIHGSDKVRKRPTKRVISNDTLTYSARQRLTSAVNLLVATARTKKLYSDSLGMWFNFRINFVTLTLPVQQFHTDKEIHNIVFKSFIRYWKTKNPNLLYIYKAEKQDNNSLHYHLTTNSFLHHAKLRKMWNKACNLLGYVTKYTESCKGKSWIKEPNNPNSTDVHAVKKVRDLSAYLCKYVAKGDHYKKSFSRYLRRYKQQLLAIKEPVFHLPKNYLKQYKQKVQIKLWDASKALLIKPLSLSLASPEISTGIQQIRHLAKKLVHFEYVSIAYLNTLEIPKTNPVSQKYLEHIKEVLAVSSKAVHVLN